MTSREKLLRRPTYWFDHEQNEIFRQVYYYMEREKINQTELSKRLGISKSRVSQILNGDLNCTLKKLIELSLSIGIVPRINYSKIEDVLVEDAQFINIKKDIEEKAAEIQLKMEVTHFQPYRVPSHFNDHLNNDSTMVPNKSRITVDGSLKNEPNYG